MQSYLINTDYHLSVNNNKRKGMGRLINFLPLKKGGLIRKEDLGPLNMSPVDRAGSVTGMGFASGSYEKFMPGFLDQKRLKILGTNSDL